MKCRINILFIWFCSTADKLNNRKKCWISLNEFWLTNLTCLFVILTPSLKVGAVQISVTSPTPVSNKIKMPKLWISYRFNPYRRGREGFQERELRTLIPSLWNTKKQSELGYFWTFLWGSGGERLFSPMIASF